MHPSELNRRCLRSIKHNPNNTENLIDGKFINEEAKLKYLQSQNKEIMERDKSPAEKEEGKLQNTAKEKPKGACKNNSNTKAEYVSMKVKMQKKYEQSTKLLQ